MQSPKLAWKGDPSGIYEVKYKKTTDEAWILPSFSPVQGLTVTVPNLDDDTEYVFAVREYCANGPASTWLFYTFKTAAAACVAPAGLVTGQVTETTAALSWAPAVSAVGGYFVEYKVDGTNSWLGAGPLSVTHYTLTGLTAGKGYQWRVKSICANGAQSTSASLAFTTVEITTQCAKIQAGAVTITSNSSNYVASYTNTGGVPSTHLLEYSMDKGASWGAVVNIFNHTVISATYALPGTVGIFPVSHMLRVTPKCADGSLGIPAVGTFEAATALTQFVTFQNALDVGSISAIRIDNNPSVLPTPILKGASFKWNEDGLLGNNHSIVGALSGVSSGATMKTSHIRGASVLWTGSSVYNGTSFPMISNRQLLDQDVIKVERQNTVNISGTIRLNVNDSSDPCHSAGQAWFQISLNQSYPEPITLQIAYVNFTGTTAVGLSGYGGDIVPADDPFKAHIEHAEYYPAQITIPANTSTYSTSSSQVYSASSLVFLRKDGQVIDLIPGGDYAGEHGALFTGYPDCNPSLGGIRTRLYYKVFSPATGVTISLVPISGNISASRFTLIKL